MRFVVAEWQWNRGFCAWFSCTLLVSFHRCSVLFMYMFLLPAGQAGEAWEPFKQQCCVGTQGSFDRKVLSLLLFFP